MVHGMFTVSGMHTHTGTHAQTIQTSRERAVTNRSKVDKDSVSQLFIVFLGAKEKEQKQSVRITERTSVIKLFIEQTRSVQENMTSL